jgi:hypothetical protein
MVVLHVDLRGHGQRRAAAAAVAATTTTTATTATTAAGGIGASAASCQEQPGTKAKVPAHAEPASARSMRGKTVMGHDMFSFALPFDRLSGSTT